MPCFVRPGPRRLTLTRIWRQRTRTTSCPWLGLLSIGELSATVTYVHVISLRRNMTENPHLVVPSPAHGWRSREEQGKRLSRTTQGGHDDVKHSFRSLIQ
jgi:hypothetical protein